MTYRNLTALHRFQCDSLGQRPALRYKRQGLYHDLSWEQYRSEVAACAAALIDCGVRPGDRVGLLSENRLEWLLADMGILAAAAINVPPHAPLTAPQIQFQLADAGVSWLFVSTQEQLGKVRQVQSDLPALRGIVVFDRAAADADTLAWESFLQRGRSALRHLASQLDDREACVSSEDLATIMYTSGTTGHPKGVMLTHGNLLSNVHASLAVSLMLPDDVALNWLPLSHIYARTVDHYKAIAAGTMLALAESAESVVANLDETQPTHFNAVPRFYEKLLTAVASPDPKKTERRLRDCFGLRLRWLGAGGAPLPVPVAEAYQAAGLTIYQGYGLTESAPVISFNREGNCRIGTVGQAIPGVEVRIADDGEVLTRGPHVMKGYWNNPQATAEAIQGGWLHTGDLGELDGEGFLKITGRKKELLVLSNGKKVVPSYIEGLLLADPCIDQAVVSGEGRSFLTALIVPHWPNLRRQLASEGVLLDSKADASLTEHPAVRAMLQSHITAALKNVAGCEQVRRFVVLAHPFTVAADELTVSLKLRRNYVVNKYRPQLDALYQLPEPAELSHAD
jgi:long-chain acyl-CoA synthetase